MTGDYEKGLTVGITFCPDGYPRIIWLWIALTDRTRDLKTTAIRLEISNSF
jgi:hypothetical protein